MAAPLKLGLLVRGHSEYGAAIRTTDFRSVQYLVHDFSDGAGAATASSSAAKTAIDIAGGSASRSVGDCSYVGSLRTLQEQTIIGSPLAEIPMSALSPKGDGDVRLVPIVSQNSQSAVRSIYRAIADQCSLQAIKEIAHELVAR